MWRFGKVEFDEARGRLQVAGRAVELDRRARSILQALLHSAGQDVDKAQLLQAGWPDRTVHENSLAKAIGRLREALGEDGDLLESVYGLGYRLAATFETEPEPQPEAEPVLAPAPNPEPGQPEPPARHRVRRPLFRYAAVAAGIVTIGLLASFSILWIDREPPLKTSEASDAVGRLLWVDDHPENNLIERRFLEGQKFAVYAVTSSEDALALLSMYEYDLVISDMGRGEEPLAGLKLVRQMRAQGNETPFYFYTIMSSDAQRELVAEAGAQGVAVTREELYGSILQPSGGVSDD